MLPNWTTEQVIALAPDPASAKAGRELAAPRKWQNIGCNESTLWGECQGSGKDPYRTCIDLAEPAFNCSCPSRKFPCKHGLGLFLQFAQNPSAIANTPPPDWMSKWVDGRAARAEKAEIKRDTVVDLDAQAKRAAQRQAKVTAGISDLQRWLHDLIRQGLVHAQTQPNSYWANQAARLIDAQAPGLANLVSALSGIPTLGSDWESHMLQALARLHTIITAYQQLDQLPTPLQADVRNAIGWAVSQDELLANTGVTANWGVLGQRQSEEGNLQVRRTWLWANADPSSPPRAALVLHFAIGKQAFESTLVLGTAINAELVFYPSAWPLRVLIKNTHTAPQPIHTLVGHANFDQFLQANAQALAALPWLNEIPAVIHDLVPTQVNDTWLLRDCNGHGLPVAKQFGNIWGLWSISGGHPITLCCEWDGASLWPLSALQVSSHGQARLLQL